MSAAIGSCWLGRSQHPVQKAHGAQVPGPVLGAHEAEVKELASAFLEASDGRMLALITGVCSHTGKVPWAKQMHEILS